MGMRSSIAMTVVGRCVGVVDGRGFVLTVGGLGDRGRRNGRGVMKDFGGSFVEGFKF